MANFRLLLQQENCISLRTAYVIDDGDLAQLRLSPADLVHVVGAPTVSQRELDLSDFAWLYRHLRSPVDERKLLASFPCIEHEVRPLLFEKDPEFKLTWTDSGNGVALYLNGEPWAFVNEDHLGYSKGVLKCGHASPWDQRLFEKVFG
jgi:hypothetical protein